MNNVRPARQEKHRFAANFVSIFASDVLNRGTTFLIYIIVARQLGTLAFGQMSLALTLFYSFQVVATFGLQQLITREVAKDRDQSDRYFVNALLVAVVTSIGATGLLAAMVFVLGYSLETRNLILLISLGIVPFAIGAICDSVIRGWEKMHLIASAQIPANLAKVVATLVALSYGGGVFGVVAILVASQFAITAILLFQMLTRLDGFQLRSLEPRFAWSLAKRSTTFMGIDTVAAWWTSLNIILLSKLTTETEVGLYNAAVQVMIPLAIFIQCVMTSSYPIMCRRFAPIPTVCVQVSSRLMELLFMLVIPGAVGLFMIADNLLSTVYGQEEFAGAASILRITVSIVILNSLTGILGQLLVAGNRERTTLRIVTVNLVTGFVLGWILISHYGVIGAAWAALLTRFVDFFQHWRPVSKLIEQIEIGRLLWKPVVASAVMAAYLLLSDDWNLVFTITTAVGVYFATYLVIESWTVGGFRNLPTRYL